jgi:quinol monooxygenase YgiN
LNVFAGSLHAENFSASPENQRLVRGRNFRYHAAMLIVHVHVHVKPESIEAFKAATLANAKASVQEPGVARFDVVQQADDPAKFILVEVYRDAAAQAAHKETKHYPVWRDAVADMMAEPRTSVKFQNIFPDETGW